MAKNKTAVQTVFLDTLHTKREEKWVHVSYERELVLLDLIKKGDVEGVRQKSLEIFETNIHNAHLSANTLRQRKYELVCAAAVVSRFSIEAGLDVETSFSLSDAYIRAADQAATEDEIIKLVQKLPLDFAGHIRLLKKKNLSSPVKKSVEYIEKHLHYTISLDDMAKLTGNNASYLSSLFKKETGMSVSGYITQKRLEEAALMLSESETPVADIAATLSFNSQSYFTLLFRKQYGKTPKDYRKEHFPSHDNDK
jgi:YesN/AraC family two-component response regulator